MSLSHIPEALFSLDGSSHPQDEDLFDEAVADVEPAALEQKPSRGGGAGLRQSAVPSGQSCHLAAADQADGAVSGVGDIDGSVVPHGHALGGGEHSPVRRAVCKARFAVSGYSRDLAVLQLQNAVGPGLGDVEYTVFPTEPHGLVQAGGRSGNLTLRRDLPHRAAAGVGGIKVPLFDMV